MRYCVLEFDELLDSSSIDAAGWDNIAKTIYNNYQLFDGFVVLHGTDSLAYTCSALSFMLQNLGKPVILTGSQAPMMELQNDAQDNLLGSLIIAGHFMIPEVCLFFNFKLFRGNRTTKVSADEFAAFDSPNILPLATISSLRTNVNWNLVYRPTNVNPLTLHTNLDTAHVACIRVFPGMKPEMMDAVLRLDGLKGLILETFGAGNTPGGPDSAMTRILADAVKRGIVIVNVTQCLSGSVSPLYAPATVLGRAGVVFGQDLTTEAALTKLAYLLSVPEATPEEVAKRMGVSIRGELTEASRTHFEHPRSGALTPELSSLTALGYSIQKGNLQEARDIIRGEPRWLLNDADYNLNTPVVSEILLSAPPVSSNTSNEFESHGLFPGHIPKAIKRVHDSGARKPSQKGGDLSGIGWKSCHGRLHMCWEKVPVRWYNDFIFDKERSRRPKRRRSHTRGRKRALGDRQPGSTRPSLSIGMEGVCPARKVPD